jgi:polyhydroxybutyrate depolymerase
VVFLHGWAARGADMLRMSAMVEAIQRRGYALILPDGLPRGDGPGQSWAFMPDLPGPRDEIAFLDAVADDAAIRFDLDRGRMLLAGYSIGGSMTSYVACAAPGYFAAYAPVAGGFWRPHPEACAGPVRLFHTHGWMDQTVPLEGRQIHEGFVQGDVFATLEIWRRTLDCGNRYPDAASVNDGLWLRSWTDCAAGGELMAVLHTGGHSVPVGWAEMALDWFERPAAAQE